MSVWISLFVLQLITGIASFMGFLYDSTQHTHYASGHGISHGVPTGHRTAQRGHGISRRVATGHRTAQSGHGIIRGVATTAPSTQRALHLPMGSYRTAHSGHGISQWVPTGHHTEGMASPIGFLQDTAQHTASKASPKRVPTRQH